MRKTISLFTGAGGLDLGLEAAGFETVVAVEMDREAVSTLRANRGWEVVAADVHGPEATTERLLARGHLGVAEAALLVGGPPCQPFSKSGYWHSGDSKRLQDPRARTLDAYLRVLEEALPEVFLLENVPGLAFSEKAEGLDLVRRAIAQINRRKGTSYTFSASQLNAAAFGVPQTRERVFVIGHREGRELRFPQPTHSLPDAAEALEDDDGGGQQLGLIAPSRELQAPLSAWDAIGHLEDDDDPSLKARGKWADLLPTIPEGSNYLYHTDRGAGHPLFGWRRRYWSMLLKLAKARPSWTLTAQPGPAIGPFHWKNRRLSAKELCALQTFPEGYSVVGDVMAAHRQLGNAVPSALAEILGLEIRRQLLGDAEADPSNPRLLPRRRGAPPPPEPPRPLPQKYKPLIGSHEAHPGTGMGPGARRRGAELGARP